MEKESFIKKHYIIYKICCWIFCVDREDRAPKDALEKLILSMRTTAKCRYNASIRLQRQGKFNFYVTIIFSLGLIFIPLIQASGIHLRYSSGTLTMVQIFLAVAILVYSVLIGTARYEVRAEKLNECGDNLKELIREIRYMKEQTKLNKDMIESFQKRYTNIVTDCENHTRVDYKLAAIEMDNDYYITGYKTIVYYISWVIDFIFRYSTPIIMLIAEVIFIYRLVL